MNQAVYCLFDGEGYGCNTYGDVDSIRKVENSQLIEAYKKILESAEVHIMFVGRENCSDCFDVFKNRFDSANRNDVYVSQNEKYVKLGKFKKEVEYDQVLQSKLVLGFASSKKYNSKLDDVIMIMTAILGGTPMSKLFVNVGSNLVLKIQIFNELRLLF